MNGFKSAVFDFFCSIKPFIYLIICFIFFLFPLFESSAESIIVEKNISQNIGDIDRAKRPQSEVNIQTESENQTEEDEMLMAEELLSQSPIIKDPFERINRKIFYFNDRLDLYLLGPVVKTYHKIFPSFVRTSISNFSNNIKMPISALNSFAQCKTDEGLGNISTFLINSTIGVLGIFDVAGNKGIISKKEDFGQTLGHYKIDSGSYLMIPFLGPSSTRDLGGTIFDKSVDIFSFNLLGLGGRTNFIDAEYRVGMTLASTISTREGLINIIDSVRRESLDPYNTVRSAYIQRRLAEVKN